MGVVDKFFFDRLGVVKNKHAAAAHDDELLLLVWVEPAYEDMRANAGGEFEVRHGDVGDPCVKEVAADGINVGRFFAGQA